MNSRIRILRLALIAVAATSALLSSGAQAGSLDIGASPAVYTGHSETGQTHVVTLKSTAGGNFNAICSTASAEGSIVGQVVSESTVTPTYGTSETAPTGCTLAGQAAQVRANGCKFTFTGAGQPANTGLVDVTGCTAATPYIQNKSALCELRIPEQNGLSHIVGTNLAGGKEVTSTATVTNITIHQVGAACPDGNGHKSTNGSLTGNTIIKAFKPNGTAQVTRHGHQYTENKCAEQVTLVST
jgi:hypothetical protein